MGQPLPSEIILPTGRPAYLNPYSGTYSESRSYAMRMQRNFARGISQSEARGHQAVGGVTESQRRSLRFEELHGIPRRVWDRLYRRHIREINKRTWAAAPGPRMNAPGGVRNDPRIFPSDIAAIKALYDTGYRDPVSGAATWEQYAEERLSQRKMAMRDYQDNHEPASGRAQFDNRTSTWVGMIGMAAPPPVELWYYH